MFYHGSKRLFPLLKRKKAWGAPSEKPLENLNAIYLTPDFSFALALAARSNDGVTMISRKNRTIQFIPPGFDSEIDVYIYFVDLEKIPGERIIWVDEGQVAVDIEEILPVKVERHKAGEILKYYSIIKGEDE